MTSPARLRRRVTNLRRRVFAWVYERLDPLIRRGTAEPRRRLLRGVEGDVLEIGAGTGANLPYFGPATRVVATDVSEHMLQRARRDASTARAPVDLRVADAVALPFEDGTFDAVVATLVLCSVPDLDAAIAEARRVLRPGGELRLFEHVRSRSRPVALLQRLANPAWGVIADGCHLDRDTEAAVRAAGFEVRKVEHYAMGMPHIALVAVNPP